MALKLDPVRLLIADDVGIGKTIEAALIARELLDRGDIERIAVLCPPHLVDQWVGELERAVPPARRRCHRGQREPPRAQTYRRARASSRRTRTRSSASTTSRATVAASEFLRACPEFVIVDEAHTCAATGQGRHQRYELLKGLDRSRRTRHLVLLTATPHSGDEAAFYRLLGLLDRDFERLADAPATSSEPPARAAVATTSSSVAVPTSPSGRRATSSRAARPRS